MRIVAVEEHFTFPDLLGRIDLPLRQQLGGRRFPQELARIP